MDKVVPPAVGTRMILAEDVLILMGLVYGLGQPFWWVFG